jgi:pyridoxal phosphate enzyme (YggS family)
MSIKEKIASIEEDILIYATSSHPVTIICVSKGASVENMQKAYDAGICHFAESRLTQAVDKQQQMPSDVIWHYIGPIQSNKAKKIAEHFNVIHSLSSFKVAKILSSAAEGAKKNLSCFIQVNITKNPLQQGFYLEDIEQGILEIEKLKNISIQGFMTIAPNTSDETQIRASFHQLFLLQKKWAYPFLSMGMSQDYKIALQEGSTHLRLGSYFFS